MRLIKTISGVFFLLLFISNSLKAQYAESNNRFSRWLLNDPLAIPGTFNSNSLSRLTLFTIGVTSISIIDEPGSSYFQKEYSRSRFLNFSNEFGAVKYIGPLSAAVFGTSLLTRNTKFQDAAFTSFQSVLNTAITVNISKFVFARSRPYENDGAYDFDFFHRGETSFPSGHSSTAFAFFTPWLMYYPGFITYSLMVVPTGTFLARIAKGKHWVSDVTAGALIGTYWGYYLSKKHMSEQGSGIEVQPFFSSEVLGLSLNISF